MYRKIALSAKSLNRLEEYYYDMFKIFVIMNNFDSARFYAQLAQKLNPRSFHLNDIGVTYLKQGNYNKALEYIMASLKNRKKAYDIGEVMNDLAEIADIYDKQKKYSLSYKYAKELLLMSSHANLRKYKMETSRISWSYFDHMGNTDSAYYYFRLYAAMKDSLRDDEFTRNMARYEMKSRDNQQRATIEIMNKQNLLVTGLLKSERVIRYVFIAIFFAGAMLVVLSFRNSWLRKKKDQIQHQMESVNQQLEQKNKEQKLSELEKQKYEFEMQALRAQMNPHFIFNSLNSINRFILQNNRDEASDYLIKFSKLMRLILQNSQTELIPLETEIETLKLYLDLEVLRYDHHIDYKILIPDDPEFLSQKVPSLLLQPYVENAIWHGLRHKAEPGLLEIEISLKGQTLNFKIRDDGIGREQAAKISGKSLYKPMGLQITAGRIAMFQRNSTQHSSVIINDLRHPDGTAAGTEVLIQIPAIYD